MRKHCLPARKTINQSFGYRNKGLICINEGFSYRNESMIFSSAYGQTMFTFAMIYF